MASNKVAERCQSTDNAKFYFASKKLFFETKTIKVLLYLAASIPIVLTFVPIFRGSETAGLVLSLISFCITLFTELSSSFMASHKELAILEHQMYEAEITGSTFSKVEYDREITNEIHELAIRKGLPKLKKVKITAPIMNVPEEISDDYSYLYLCRIKAATEKFLLSRIFTVYFFVLIAVSIFFVFGSLLLKGNDPATYLTLIIGFYPVIMPIIKDCMACKKTMKKCTKLCADIDNFFADGDESIGRLARFHYYVQNLEFEMLVDRPAVFNVFPAIFRRGVRILQEGVTYRFLDSIKELKERSLILKGEIQYPKGKSIITKVNYYDAYMEKQNKTKLKAKTLAKINSNKVLEEKVEEPKEVVQPEQPVVKKTRTVKKTTDNVESDVKPSAVRKTIKKVVAESQESPKATTTRKPKSTSTK